MIFSNQILGSSLSLPAHGWVGARSTPILSPAAHFAEQKILNCFFLLQNTKSAGESKGRQKFIPPNPLSFCPPERSVSILPREARPSGVFSEIFDKVGSSGIVKTHQNLTFGKLTDHFVGGTKCRPSISPRQILSARRGEPRLAVGQDEVRLPCDFNSVSDLLCPITKSI